MPPPDPRSSTVSPCRRSAIAVGLPHPSEASSAGAGHRRVLCGAVEAGAEAPCASAVAGLSLPRDHSRSHLILAPAAPVAALNGARAAAA